MWTSMVRERPTPACPQTSLASSSRLLSSPAAEASTARSSNSLRRRPRGSPPTRAVKFLVSSWRSPASRILAAPAGRAPLQVGVDAGEELLHAEGLGHVVVGPGLKPADLVLL